MTAISLWKKLQMSLKVIMFYMAATFGLVDVFLVMKMTILYNKQMI